MRKFIEDAITDLTNECAYRIDADNNVEIVRIDPESVTVEAIKLRAVELEKDFTNIKYQRNRASEYPNTNDLIVALWEKVIEGRSESADALEVKRQEVKTAHPKPE